jgi:predicted dehydrogenase
MAKDISRRVLIGTAASTAIGAGLLGSRMRVAEAAPARGANDAVNFGLIGCGGRGSYLAGIFKPLPGVKFVAVCDVNRDRAARVQKALDGKPKAYQDFRQVLAHKEIDAIIVATTGHWHVLPMIEACAAGKDVYMEKPVGTSIGEGRAAIKAARKYDRIVQMGTQQRSWEHYRQAVEIVRSGVLGNISNVEVFDLENFTPGFGSPPDGVAPPELDWDFYVGPSPSVPFNQNRYDRHYWFHDYGGGWQLDWAVHHYDIVNWAMGVDSPVAAIGHGGKFAFPNDNTQWPDTFIGACEYPPGPVARNGFLLSYIFRGACSHLKENMAHGKIFYGSKGVLALDRQGYVIYNYEQGGKVVEEKQREVVSENEAVTRHAKGFLDCVRAHKQPEAIVEKGHAASNPGHLMNIALRVGRRVKWNPEIEQVEGDAEANKLVTRQYRSPWSLPA